jgi:AmmeMemoRadiSam system protein B
MAPHAGYIYSGPTAAAVFARAAIPELVVILAPNHTGVCDAEGGVSLWESGAFRTPLGEVPVDESFGASLLAASSLVGVDHDAHRSEHAVEVELPFLQIVQPAVRIVPLVVAWDAWPQARALGETLAEMVRAASETVLLLASSDLNHYEAAPVSERKDARALEAVTALDGAELLSRCKREGISMCGRGPAAIVIAAARALGVNQAEVVDYRHSGWASGDDRRVVGYAGVVLT